MNLNIGNDAENLQNNILDFGGVFEFYFNKARKYRRSSFIVRPYILAGVKFLYIPKGKRNTNMSLPLGIGFKFVESKNFSASFEYKLHYTNTDELDLQTDYQPTGNFFSATNDLYSFVGIVINFNIRKRNKFQSCPAYF